MCPWKSSTTFLVSLTGPVNVVYVVYGMHIHETSLQKSGLKVCNFMDALPYVEAAGIEDNIDPTSLFHTGVPRALFVCHIFAGPNSKTP